MPRGQARVEVDGRAFFLPTAGAGMGRRRHGGGEHQSDLNTSAAAAMVASMSASVWAALTKPASYSAGAM